MPRKPKDDYTNYTLCYNLTATSFIKVCYYFDKKPIEIFNAMLINRNLDRSVLERYGIDLTNN